MLCSLQFCGDVGPMCMCLPFSLTPVSILDLLAWTNELTLFSSGLLPLLLQREPLIILCIIITHVDHHVNHRTVHLNRSSIWELIFQLKLTVRCITIQLQWFHARVPIPQTSTPGVKLFINIHGL